MFEPFLRILTWINFVLNHDYALTATRLTAIPDEYQGHIHYTYREMPFSIKPNTLPRANGSYTFRHIPHFSTDTSENLFEKKKEIRIVPNTI